MNQHYTVLCMIMLVMFITMSVRKNIDFIPSSYHLSVEGNGSSEFNKFTIVSLIVDDGNIVIPQVPSQYCGSHMKMSNFTDHFYLSIFVVMDFFVYLWEKIWRVMDMD
ncbi:hypothetical protein H5410_003537 [Solanum commersonii]|uniref:Transmembrane protein n=1 Tax=Solanum commersonii TaxID=4109 RepID=A0A9J6B5F2_SOLCO|nr:hypothetical protein H5410_003537 [Solanum commersonii]